ncbi:hypothetical protein KW785_01030 [Candidatus Parcubacteria bacterium]|nr:hypothetical protein [Candidatus Parcubacteria bacterium]
MHFTRAGKYYVIVFGFDYSKPSGEDLADLQKKFAHYACNSWTAFVWDNPNLTTTVNFIKRVRARATKKIVASGKYLGIIR